jgi:hypothetical protein
LTRSIFKRRLPVAAIGINNPDRSPLGINGCDPAEAPSGLGEPIGDDFPILHHLSMLQNTIVFGASHAFQVTRI